MPVNAMIYAEAVKKASNFEYSYSARIGSGARSGTEDTRSSGVATGVQLLLALDELHQTRVNALRAENSARAWDHRDETARHRKFIGGKFGGCESIMNAVRKAGLMTV